MTIDTIEAAPVSTATERLTYVNRQTGQTCIAEVETDGLVHSTVEAFDYLVRGSGYELAKAVGRRDVPSATPERAADIMRERDDALAALGVSKINREALETDARALATAAGAWVDDFEATVRRLGATPSPEEAGLIVAVAKWRARFA